MSSGRRLAVAALLVAGGLGFHQALRSVEGASAAAPKRPNVIFILTDDETLTEMAAMPKTQALLGGGGTSFDRYYVSYPLCCPSRVTMLTGQYMHNHQVRGNSPPLGGWERFQELGEEKRDLPVWLQSAGYYTVGLGKYLNGYPSVDPPVPTGWNEWYGKLSQYDAGLFGNQIYFNYSLLERGPEDATAKLVNYGQNESDYSTDVLVGKAIDAIRRLGGPGGTDKPFFIDLSLSAPHSPYVAAPQHAGAFAGAAVPTSAAVNERNMKDKPRFMRRIHPLRSRQLRLIRDRTQNRWAQLLSVDDGVQRIVDALADVGRLGDTYIVFTSDNGYFAGEHRIAQGKYLPLEPSAHVPLLVRGPGIPAGGHSSELVGNVDVAPTIAEIGGATPAVTADGRSFLQYAKNPALRTTRPILLEGDTGANLTGGEAVEASARLGDGLRGKKGVGNLEQEPIARIARRVKAPAYRAIRTDRYLYVRYTGGADDLYDMTRDPLQLHSRYSDRRYSYVKRLLRLELAALQDCAGASCRLGLGADPAPAGEVAAAGRHRK